MSVIRRIGAVLALLLGVTACSSGAPQPSASPAAPSGGSSAATRPNVVFVLTDDLSMNLVQYMPHVLALEKAGTSFSNYSVTDSLCCPSRSSIFTGKFPHNTGVFTNTGPDGGFKTFYDRGDDKATFATALQSVGYRTAMMGKYLNGYSPSRPLDGEKNYVPPGWNEWDVADNGYPEYNYTLNANHKVEHFGSKPADYLTNVISRRGSAFITSSAAAHKPFLLELATFAPHSPYTPAPRDSTAFPGLKAPRTAAYDTLPAAAPDWLTRQRPLTARNETAIDVDFRKRVQAVQSVDRMIGSLEATLTKAGVAGNTDIVFSSDNGYHMGEYRLNPGKMTAFETDIHVPLVMTGPGIAAGRTLAESVENIDLCPTLESLGGASVPANVDGRSLLPLLNGKSGSGWRTTALVEHHGPDTMKGDPDLPGTNSGNPPSYEALRTATYTYVEYVDGTKEYYDRVSDPNELHNIVRQQSAATLARLHHTVTAISTCHGERACWAAAR